eukprot:TRINITY_DN14905_c0_g1_i1.p3 TRINITY_DN14905_c0_g1~~TRINITY_DN14905_c0_g1_i1.p3  ORF type:complete len:142 (-),score=66.41 TRINITY_DN14905_c0_g1_i1:53-478(-)
MARPLTRSRTTHGNTSRQSQGGLLHLIREQDADGYLLCMCLKHCSPPTLATPEVLWRCAQSGKLLRALLAQVEATDPDMRVWMDWKALRSLWEQGKHKEAVEIVIRRLLELNPGAVSYTHLRAHETVLDLVCRLLLEKKKK